MKNELTGAILTEPMLIGKHKRQLPILFDEIYVMYPENADKANMETKYTLYTQPTLRYKTCGSRISGGKFEAKEVANLRLLRQKAGLVMEDKTWQ